MKVGKSVQRTIRSCAGWKNSLFCMACQKNYTFACAQRHKNIALFGIEMLLLLFFASHQTKGKKKKETKNGNRSADRQTWSEQKEKSHMYPKKKR